MSYEELKRLARLIGYSSYQLKAYLTLVEKGPLTAKDIARLAGIPTSKVYSVLSSLARDGIIYSEQGRPLRFIAKPPREVFSTILEKLNGYIEATRPIIDSLQLLYESNNPSKVMAQSDIFFIVKGLESTKQLMRKALNASSIDIAIPYVDLLDNEAIADIDAVSRNSEVRLLVTDNLIEVARRLPPRVVARTRSGMFGAGIIGDGVVLAVKYDNTYLTLYSIQDYLLDIAKTYFNSLWKDAAPIGDR
ncbi:MAG: helix-turn-helix domain-containing protein [Thermocladium sp.]|jgi:sugar-specific transcriptional regulator TrmB|nr:MAG: TrmB family transcriptional regulator [Thermocladium sp. ECH_B]